MDENKTVIIRTEEIEEFVYNELIKRGLAPSKKEAEILADILFDFMIHKDIIEEEY